MIHIVTDSCVDLPEYLLQQNNIHVVPLTIRVKDKEFIEGVNITPQEFYKEMEQSSELPQTSQPTPAQFAKVFKELTGKGPVLCLTISSKLSGSFNSANLGKELSGNTQVTVFDSMAASIGQGLQVLKAAELVQKGMALPDILSQLNTMREEMKFLILLDTLDNLVKGGRLSHFQGSLAKLLHINVILYNVDGVPEILEKVRGHHKSLERLLELVGKNRQCFLDQAIGITHVNNLADAQFLADKLKERYHPKEIIINEMGATVSTYAGKLGIIVAY